MTQHDTLDQALWYITALKERVESLKQRHKEVEAAATSSTSVADPGNCSFDLQPQVIIRNQGPNLEVNLVCGLRAGFMLPQLISILEQEGADVVTVSFNRVGDRIFHTIHCQVINKAIDPRIFSLSNTTYCSEVNVEAIHAGHLAQNWLGSVEGV